MNIDKMISEAMDRAGNVLGADPAYFGEEGEKEVDKQLILMGYSLEQIRTLANNAEATAIVLPSELRLKP